MDIEYKVRLQARSFFDYIVVANSEQDAIEKATELFYNDIEIELNKFNTDAILVHEI